jgi:hypothetical protein
VRKKFPTVTDDQEINRLAIKAEQNRTTWICIGLLWASVLLAVLWCFDFVTGTLAIFCTVFFIVTAFEYFRTVLNSKKIKVHYPNNVRSTVKGALTYHQIRQDCKLTADNEYSIIKATLCDKDDRDDSGVSDIFHKYTLFFKKEDNVSVLGLRVKRRIYLEAPLDAEYILVVTPNDDIKAIYIADAWEVSPELHQKCAFSADLHNSNLQKDKEVTQKSVPKDNIAINILLLIAHILAWVMPIIITVLYLPVTTFFATKAAVKNQTWLSVLNIVLGYVVILYTAIFLCL